MEIEHRHFGLKGGDMNPIGEVNYFNPAIDGKERNAQGIDKLGKNDFLNLLVTQLRFQDPLEPMKDQEFVAQLAQFSQLEKLENMQSSLDTSTQINYVLSQTIANTMATTLIGKTVIAEGADFTLSGDEDVRLSYELGADAADVTIRIKNANGAVVRTIETHDLRAGNQTNIWDGRDDNNRPVAPGQYSYEVTATTRTGESIAVNKRVIGKVESVKYTESRAYLIVGGYKVDLSTILEIVEGNDNRYSNH